MWLVKRTIFFSSLFLFILGFQSRIFSSEEHQIFIQKIEMQENQILKIEIDKEIDFKDGELKLLGGAKNSEALSRSFLLSGESENKKMYLTDFDSESLVAGANKAKLFLNDHNGLVYKTASFDILLNDDQLSFSPKLSAPNSKTVLPTEETFFLPEKRESHIVKIEEFKIDHSYISGRITGHDYVKSAKIKVKRVQGERLEEETIDIVGDIHKVGREGFFKRNNLPANRGKPGLFLTQVQTADLWGQVSASVLLGFRVVLVLEMKEILEEGHPTFVVQIMGSEKEDQIQAFFRQMRDPKGSLADLFSRTVAVKLDCALPDREGIRVCHGAAADEVLDPFKKYEYWVTVENSSKRLLSQSRYMQFVKHNYFVDKIIKEKLKHKVKVKRLKANHRGISMQVENYQLISYAELVITKVVPVTESFTKRYILTEELLNRKGKFEMIPEHSWGEGVFSVELNIRDYDRYSVKGSVPTFAWNGMDG